MAAARGLLPLQNGRPIRVLSPSARKFYEAMGYRVVADRVWKSRGGLDIVTLDMEKPIPGST